jgi:hypothetical protein
VYSAASGRTNIDPRTLSKKPCALAGHLHRRKCGVDSIIQKIDEEKYARKFNPRRKESKWSETNKRRVLKVIREGRMTEAGMAKVTFDLSKVDMGKPKARRPRLKMPEKIEKALKSRPTVWEAFQKAPPSLQRNYILWLSDAKKPETFEGDSKYWLKKSRLGSQPQCISVVLKNTKT